MGKVKDYFGTEVKDMDAILYSTAEGKLNTGIYFNNRIVTQNYYDRLVHKNINQVTDIVVIDKEKIKDQYEKLLEINSKEFNTSKELREITVNELEAGGVYETKSGIQYIYLGDQWRMGCMGSESKRLKAESYRRCFFRADAEKYDFANKDRTLSDLIEDSMVKCEHGMTDMLNLFKFSVPKLYKHVGTIDRDELKDFEVHGKFGLLDENTKDLIIIEGVDNIISVTIIGDKVGYYFPSYSNKVKMFMQNPDFKVLADNIKNTPEANRIIVK